MSQKELRIVIVSVCLTSLVSIVFTITMVLIALQHKTPATCAGRVWTDYSVGHTDYVKTVYHAGIVEQLEYG